MCDPVTIGVTLMVVGAVGGAYSSYQETKAANAAKEYNAQINERNAEVAKMQAADATERGKIAEKQQRLKTAQAISTGIASGGASGFTVNTGSFLDTRLDTARYGELDAMTIRRNAAMEAWGFEQNSANYGMQANASRLSKQSPGMAAATSLLGSASSFGSMMASSGSKK